MTERSKKGAVELPVGTPRHVLCRCRGQVGRVPVGHVEETGRHVVVLRDWLVARILGGLPEGWKGSSPEMKYFPPWPTCNSITQDSLVDSNDPQYSR